MADPAQSSSAFSFVDMEHQILDFWEQGRVFQRTLENTREKKPYIFYDGPPFATGLPHHGHIVASTIKDIVPRYWTMKGRYVLRRFGWDCHGLPIEHEIDKQLNMSAQQAVAEMGVAGYNQQCRAIVQRYVDEWRHTITRLGRWVDFDNDYKTMDAWYMESVWWVLKQLWEQGLVYQGVKVMPVSTALGTPLSNFEANQNYMDVQDPAITVLFKLVDEEAYLSAWTTTPWTLPSNLAICVGPDIDYVRVRDADLGADVYMAAERVADYGSFEEMERLKGRELVGRRYQPLFPYFSEAQDQGAFVVVMDDYVTTESGTGLVHQAPAFGDDDYRIARAAGIAALVCPVTVNGEFTDEVTDFAGQYVKDADREIIRYLKDHGLLYRQEVIQHSYPYCYRSDTPLIYRAIPSWYVRVTEFVDKLVRNNQQIRWVPDHIKTGRFGNWLEGAIDWSISRNRVWGTPIPIWINDVTGKEVCIGSIDELEALTGVRVDDLHREHVDPLSFTLEGEEGTYRRIEEVLDCWFESGSMPYAQLHYPFENEKVFKAGFPAEFIAEGLDQTRGWFYTLTVLAAALYDKPAFRNVIVNGMVMAEDGKKMSKRLRNYTPPDELMETYGADALRLYLINSGLMRGEEQRFADAGVRDMTRRALLPWYNAFTFLKTYAEIDHWSPDKGQHTGDNVLDQWILSRLQTLKANVAREMEVYKLYNVVPQLFDFIEDLTNWYIRLNRQRFWGEDITADKIAAYSTLYTTLYELCQVMAPFAPFLAEHVYQQLSALGGGQAKPESVHLCDYPEPEEALIRSELEEAVDRMQQVVLLGRQKREEVKIGLRTPLRRLTIVNRDQALLDELARLEGYVKTELNVLAVSYDDDEGAHIEVVAKPNFPVLGKRLGKRMKAFQGAIQALSAEQIAAFQAEGEIELEGETFNLEEIEVLQKARAGTNTISNSRIAVDLDCALDEELVRGGYAREIVNRIQRRRKELELNVADRIEVCFAGDAALLEAAAEHRDYIAAETLATGFAEGEPDAQAADAEIDGKAFRFSIVRAGS
ncbi:MAG: isoleucine--tRNA ligase [Pseudomonadales bacterium]|nr:isoleucine--tRNA ligase [Pseudomonadales bacterium]NIX08052.1 isoleucine--tRNA ligase [Pseudomonadales bacterium]